ncbi:MAG TPA: serine/threonine-protein kinase [Ktedonobacteraceae bacterium]|jgi:serine/threonine protein kinase
MALGNNSSAFQLAASAGSASEDILTPGFLLAERYEIVEQIGAGGFGIVYKARDRREHQRLVAVKQISLDHLSPREIIQATDSYNREITFQPLCTHKNIPAFFDQFTDQRHWYLVMEYIAGETLEAYLQRIPGRKLPLRTVLTIGIQLCDVLHYLHRTHGIVFRDVKPANILRTRNGRLYLIDFGIARWYVPGKTKDTAPLGSPGYAAPEQYGAAQTSARTDIYGLGATLLVLLNGFDPAEKPRGKTPSVPPSPEIPQKLHLLLNQMLALDANQRPTHMALVKRRLLLIRDGILGRLAFHALTILGGVLLLMLPFLLSLFSARSFLLTIWCCIWIVLAAICFLCNRGWRLLGLSFLLALLSELLFHLLR